VVIGLEQGTDLHMAKLMSLPLTVSCFSKIQIGFAFLVLAYPGSPGKRAVKRVCACVYASAFFLSLFSKPTNTKPQAGKLGLPCHTKLWLQRQFTL